MFCVNKSCNNEARSGWSLCVSCHESSDNWELLYNDAKRACQLAKEAIDDLTGWSGSSGNWILHDYSQRINLAVGAFCKSLCEDLSCPTCDIPIKEKEQDGIYYKFNVKRTDGSSAFGRKHMACDYFVLDWMHDPFSIPAARAYADACEIKYPVLAADLRAKADRAEKQMKEK